MGISLAALTVNETVNWDRSVCFLLWFIASFLACIATVSVRTERNRAARKSFFRTSLLLPLFRVVRIALAPFFAASDFV